MDRRTRQLLAQMLQQRDQRGTSAVMVQAKPAQTAVLERHLDVCDRLSAVRRLDPGPRDTAAGREQMLAALSSAPDRSRSTFSLLLLTPLLRSAAIVLGLLVLTGAAAGASAALGGPHLWRTVGVNRNSDRAIERSESSGPRLNPTDDGAGSEAGSGSQGTVDDSDSGDSPSSSGGSDVQDGDYAREEGTEEYTDGIASDAAPAGAIGASGAGAASSSPNDELDEGEAYDDNEERSATPNLNLTPTPQLQNRANMTYDEDDADDADDADVADDADDFVDHEDADDANGGDEEEASSVNTGSSAAAEPHQGPSNVRADIARQKGQGRN